MVEVVDAIKKVRSMAKIGFTLHLLILGMILMFESVVVLPVPSYVLIFVKRFIALELMVIAFQPRFLTPQIRTPICPHCGAFMVTKIMECDGCGRTLEPPR